MDERPGASRPCGPVTIVGNGASGRQANAGACRGLLEHLRAAGVEVELQMVQRGGDLARAARRAVQAGAKVVVAAGGDGTVNAVASAVVGTPAALGVIPLGTFNYFARRLELPEDCEAAARVLTGGREALVDVGEVNGHTFMNNASIGLYARMLRDREARYARWGRSRLHAYLSAAHTLLSPARLLRVRMELEGQPLAEDTPLVFVVSNAYQLEAFNTRGRGCLEQGRLAIFTMRPLSRAGLVGLGARALLRRLRKTDALEVRCAQELRVETRRRHLSVALDGELLRLEAPLLFRMRRRALRVRVPTAPRAEAEARPGA